LKPAKFLQGKDIKKTGISDKYSIATGKIPVAKTKKHQEKS
jgi:hypothetical protein